ncbi:MAG TPA: hypothetical protein PLU35_11205 [Phycisphaerales bacterium]|nr:hypothetical protein [Phycisphaerales bacterium]
MAESKDAKHDPTGSPAAFDTANQVYQHVRLLWEEEAAFAEDLVEKRKTFSTILTILVGLGLFRVQLYRRADEVMVLGPWAALIIKVLAVVALSFFALGVWWLYTQRPIVRGGCRRVWHESLRWGRYLWRLARSGDNEERERAKPDSLPPPPWPRGRAIEAVLPDNEELDDWFVLTPLQAAQARTAQLREAYRSLRVQNQRVYARLRAALASLMAGFLLVLAILFVYTWSTL